MSISCLPVEVLEKIFQGLDGRTFCLAKRVNKNWNNLVKQMQKSQTLWQRFCIREINSTVIEDILSVNYLSQEILNCWCDVYQKWYLGHLILQKSYGITKIFAFDSIPITCITVSGSWVITGHSNGYVCFWNKDMSKLYQQFIFHEKAVTDIALVDLLNINCYYGSEENYHWSHHHVITVSKDTCIRVTSVGESLKESANSPKEDVQVLHKHGDALHSVRVFGNQFVVASRDNTVTLWRMEAVKDPFFRLNITFLKSIIGPEGFLKTIGFWDSQIYCITMTSKLVVYENDGWLKKSYFKNKLKRYFGTGQIITACYAFRDEVVIVFSADGKMFVSLPGDDRSATYCAFKELRTSVVSVAFSGTTLALGGENGRLYVFHVPCDESLLRLDLTRPDFCEMLSVASIVCVRVGHHRNAPVVVASTTETLFYVRWYKDEDQRLSLSTAAT